MPYTAAQWRAIAADYHRRYPKAVARMKLRALKQHKKK